MKNFFKIISLLLVFFSVLNCISCVEPKENICFLLKKICENLDGEKNVSHYFLCSQNANHVTPNEDLRDFNQISDEKFGYLYLGKFEKPSVFDRIEKYAVCLPDGLEGYEIHILCGINYSDREKLAGLLEKRGEMLKNYEILEFCPEQYEKYFKGAEVFVYKNAAFLLCTPANYEVKKIIRKFY